MTTGTTNATDLSTAHEAVIRALETYERRLTYILSTGANPVVLPIAQAPTDGTALIVLVARVTHGAPGWERICGASWDVEENEGWLDDDFNLMEEAPTHFFYQPQVPDEWVLARIPTPKDQGTTK